MSENYPSLQHGFFTRPLNTKCVNRVRVHGPMSNSPNTPPLNMGQRTKLDHLLDGWPRTLSSDQPRPLTLYSRTTSVASLSVHSPRNTGWRSWSPSGWMPHCLPNPSRASSTNVDGMSRTGPFVPFTINAGRSTNLPMHPEVLSAVELIAQLASKKE